MTAVVSRLRAIPTWQVTLGLALLALGFLIAAQLAAEGPRIRYTTQEREPLVGTARELQAQQDGLKARIVELRTQIGTLEEQGQGTTALVRQLNDQLEQARIAAGLIRLSGTGLVLRLDDSTQPIPPGDNAADYLVSARDLRTVIAELWLAGAEAIAVNQERVAVSTAVIDIGGSVLVNSANLAPPFQVAAIGPSDLFSQLSASQGWADFIRSRRGIFGIGVSFAEPAVVEVPQFAGGIVLRESRAIPSATPGPAPSAAP